jgi:superfamily I DNA and/or RNA helicase
MERIVRNQPDAVTLLRVQYRMNDAIMHFSSQWFYGGKVESAPEVTGRSVLDYDTPMVWVDTSSPDVREKYKMAQVESSVDVAENEFAEQYVGENHGRVNKAEAEMTLMLLEEYIEKIGKQRFLDERLDVGVISPYKVQTQYIRSLIKKRQYFKPLRQYITVNTVDGFQGQERDIMMISLVRSNDSGQIGFLSDLRRMNVAITRARMKLIIIGDASTLSHHPFYKKLHEYVLKIND